MTKIAPVKTVNGNKALWFDAQDLDIKVGQNVVVETARGTEFGVLEQPVFEADKKQLKSLKSELKPVLRVADDKDIDKAKKMAKKSQDALPFFKEFAAETNPKMNPISVEYLFDGKKAVFYFSAPERQDFRDLIKKLSGKFKLRVDMRQINERDEAALVGGIGICGQELCCMRLGKCPKHISIKMAKDQGMSLNPENISGMCGKLLCCLDYEFEDYNKFMKNAPKLKGRVLTPQGEAVVTDINMPKAYVEIMLLEDEKRYKIPVNGFKIDKAFARKISGTVPENVRPNRVEKDAWESATSDNFVGNLESVYVSTKLEGSEKLASGGVKVLPTRKRRDHKHVADEKPQKSKKQDRRKPRNRSSRPKIDKNVNVYESQKSTTVRRRSRKIGSGTSSNAKSSTTPGHKSSGLRNKK